MINMCFQKREVTLACLLYTSRYVKKFLKYVDGNEITKELVIQYRELLEREGSAYSTINLILISINCYFLILEFDLKTTD